MTGGTLGFSGGGALGSGPVVVDPGNGNSAGLLWYYGATTDLTTSQTGGLTLASGNTVLNPSGSTVTFTGTIAGTGSLEISGGTLQFGSYSSSSGGLGSVSAVTIDAGGALAFDRTDTCTVGTPIAGTGVLVQEAGTLILTGANTYSGGTSLNAWSGGTLQVGNGGSSGSLGTGPVFLNASSGVLIFNEPGTVIVPNAINGSGGLTQVGSGTLVFTGSGGTYTGGATVNGSFVFDAPGTINFTGSPALSGPGSVVQQGGPASLLVLGNNNTYSGGTLVTSGTISFGYNGLGTGPVVVNPGNGNTAGLTWTATTDLTTNQTGGLTLASGNTVFNLGSYNTVTFTGTIAGTGSLEISSGTLQIGGWNGNGGSLGNVSAVTLDAGGTLGFYHTGIYSATCPINGPGGLYIEEGTLAFNRTDTCTISGLVNGYGSGIWQMGPGTLALTGSGNTYAGGTTVTGGALAFGASGLGNGRVFVDPGVGKTAWLIWDQSAGSNTTDLTAQAYNYNGLTLNSGITGFDLRGKTVTFGSNGSTSYSSVIGGTGGLEISGGTLMLDGNSGLGSLTSVALVNNGDGPGYLAFNGTGGTTLNLPISGVGGLIQAGSDTLTLHAANTYSGTTLANSGTLTVANSAALQYSTLDTSGAGTISFGALTAATLGGLTGSRPLGSGNCILSVGNNGLSTTYSSVLSGAGGLAKIGGGVLTFTGSNTYTGGTSVNGGSLLFDFSAAGAPASNIVNYSVNSSALTLGGGTLAITGAASGGPNSQRFNGFTLAADASTIRLNKNGNSNLPSLSLGALANAGTAGTPGSALLLDASLGGTITTATNKDSSGIYGGRIVYYDGTNYNWATTASTGSPYVLSGAITTTNLPASGAVAGTNYFLAAGGSVTASETANTLKISPTASGGTLAISSGQSLTLAAGGLLFTGSNDYTISGGSLTAGNGSGGYGLIFQQYAANNNLTLLSAVTNNGANATSLTKTGPGTVTLAATNTYSGGTSVLAGTLALSGSIAGSTVMVGESGTGSFIQSAGTNSISSALYLGYNAAGNGSYTLNGGSLGLASTSGLYVGDGGTGSFTQSGGTITAAGNVYIGCNLGSSGTYNQIGGSLSVAFAGTNLDVGYNGTGSFTQSSGTDTVYALNLGYAASGNGTYNLNGGTLIVSAISGGPGAAAFNFNGGTLQAAHAFSIALPMTFATPGGNATIDTGGYAVTLSGQLSGPGGLIKIDTGTLTLAAANTFSGNTLVSGGTLALANTAALQNSAVTVNTTNGLAFTGAGAYQLGALGGSGSFALNNTAGTSGIALSVGAGGASGTFSGSLAGSGSLAQVGSGTLLLTGSNSYRGGTSVSGGMLAAESQTAGWAARCSRSGGNGSLVLGTPGALEPLGVLGGGGARWARNPRPAAPLQRRPPRVVASTPCRSPARWPFWPRLPPAAWPSGGEGGGVGVGIKAHGASLRSWNVSDPGDPSHGRKTIHPRIQLHCGRGPAARAGGCPRRHVHLGRGRRVRQRRYRRRRHVERGRQQLVRRRGRFGLG